MSQTPTTTPLFPSGASEETYTNGLKIPVLNAAGNAVGHLLAGTIVGRTSVTFQVDGAAAVSGATTVNFAGLLTGTVVNNVLTVTGRSAAIFADGSSLTDNPLSVDFAGDGVTTTYDGGTGRVTVTINGSALEVRDENTPVTTGASSLSFVGAGVEAVHDEVTGRTTINIPGGAVGGDQAYTLAEKNKLAGIPANAAAPAWPNLLTYGARQQTPRGSGMGFVSGNGTITIGTFTKEANGRVSVATNAIVLKGAGLEDADPGASATLTLFLYDPVTGQPVDGDDGQGQNTATVTAAVGGTFSLVGFTNVQNLTTTSKAYELRATVASVTAGHSVVLDTPKVENNIGLTPLVPPAV